jgi:hypothetical protein
MKKIFLSIFLAFTLVNFIFAGEISVKAKLEPSEILIGEQAKFKIELSQPSTEKISWPVIADTLATNVHVLEKLSVDTVLVAEKMNITAEYLVTSYDSGYYYIPELTFETTTISFLSISVFSLLFTYE